MMRTNRSTVVFVVTLLSLSGALARAVTLTAAATPAAQPNEARIERGAYLVRTMGCNDCHTPWKLGPRGPEPDMSRALTGHPADFVVTAPKTMPDAPWTWMAVGTNTAFAGPWGVSFTANLTPDPETGLGKWTEEMFMQALKTGRHEGKGRPILPPMPWPMIGTLTDEDLKSVFAYLQSLKPVRNQVPQPIDPPEKP